MDRISLLPEDLILKILSSVPTKFSVTTSLLSKRWCYLWKHVPKLLFYLGHSDSQRASRLVHTFLLLNKAPVLESMHLSLGQNGSSIDIDTWTRVAISRGVRNLLYSRFSATLRLPRSLYTCETLVTLTLIAAIIVDVPLTNICFPSLKALILLFVDFLSDEIVSSLLSGCPVLTELNVSRFSNARVKTFTVFVPSLQCLTIIDIKKGSQAQGDDVGFVIKAPSLNSLTIYSEFSWFCSLVKMPYLVKANVKLPHGGSKKFKGCLTSAKHLSLCLQPPLDPSHIGVFDQLVSLNLCTCSLDWCGLILRHTPKLRVLRFVLFRANVSPKIVNIIKKCRMSYGDSITQWEQPSSVPQCLTSSLETVEWIDYKGTKTEKEMVMYFLKNSRQLKKVCIRSLASINLNEKHKMLLELASAQRISSECRLLFT
ncbi:hypothetical protein Bca52824_043894 [Brassica carinata]|uniref:FBD domain-containing protein n=1 Tax=Brassica carinata TaxID=52824 RepID=A0A8X7UYS2_BRACI|nr:hypothetical protein Bca52824_043894 [Brassica carinata]